MRFLLPAVSFLFLAALAEPALADGPGLLVVNSASADDGVLTIRGGNFGNAAPYVTLGGLPLVVLSSNPEEIEAQLPDGTAPGSYLLVVARHPHRIPFYLFDVTIGAAGPQGDRGPKGDRGPQGDPGHNEVRGGSGDNRSGSHNLVVGSKNNYTSYGGFVGGLQTGVTAPFSTAFFGQAFDFRATGAWALRAMTFNVDTDQSAQVRAGTTLSLRAAVAADLRGDGTLVLKGGQVQIN